LERVAIREEHLKDSLSFPSQLLTDLLIMRPAALELLLLGLNVSVQAVQDVVLVEKDPLLALYL